MKRYLFFDLGGTLIDTQEGAIHAYEYALDGRYSVNPADYSSLLGSPVLDALMDVWGLSLWEAKRTEKRFWQYYNQQGIAESCIEEGALQMLKRLSTCGATLYAVSSAVQQTAEMLFAHHGAKQYFSGIFGASEDGSCSSKEDILSAAIRQENLDHTEEILLIGDTWRDRIAANILGMDFVRAGYSRGGAERSSGELSADSIAELTDILLTLCT